MCASFHVARVYFTLIAFLAMLVLGGSSAVQPEMKLIFSGLSIATLAIWLESFRSGFATKYALWLSVIFMLAGLVIAAQLVPLPPNLWASLPGREFISEALVLSGQSGAWLPISLDTEETRNVLVNILPGVAFFVVGQKITAKESWFFVYCFVVFAIGGVVLGLAQRFSPLDSGLYLHQELGNGLASGTFRNRNNFAASLYVSIPFLFAISMYYLDRRERRSVVVMVATLCYLAIITAGLAGSASRSGMLLSMVAIFVSMAMAVGLMPENNGTRNKGMTRFALASILVFILIFGQFGMLAIMRLAETDTMNDQRWVIWTNSFESAKNFFPVGSGFGTFVPVYQLIEKPADMFEGMYVNHAHNDWLELAMEGGAPIALVLASFLVWLIAATWSAWLPTRNSRVLLVPRAASISSVLLLLHSLVEFPLRNPAMMSSFTLCLGILAAAGKHRQELQNGQKHLNRTVFADGGPSGLRH